MWVPVWTFRSYMVPKVLVAGAGVAVRNGFAEFRFPFKYEAYQMTLESSFSLNLPHSFCWRTKINKSFDVCHLDFDDNDHQMIYNGIWYHLSYYPVLEIKWNTINKIKYPK